MIDTTLIDKLTELADKEKKIKELRNRIRMKDLIIELQEYDNPAGYRLRYENVSKKLNQTINKLKEKGEEALEELHALLENEETWSCLFALEIIKEIKSEKSVPVLINHIIKNDGSDHFESGETAMLALNEIGSPAVAQLIKAVEEQFDKKKFIIYLVGALTEIKDDRVCLFMVETIKDYLQDYKKYDQWFDLISFVMDFDKQEKKEVIPLLKELVQTDHLSEKEIIEIEDTIKYLEDPEEFEKSRADLEIDESLLEDVEKILHPEKIEFTEELSEKAGEVDEELMVSFICGACSERQNVKTGLVWWYEEDKFSFENEIRCSHCSSNDMGLSNQGKEHLSWKLMRVMIGKDNGIFPVGDKIAVENKGMSYKKVYPFVCKRISEEPENGELRLRAANCARKSNKYGEAIEWYKKSLQLDPKLIASYINLVEIFIHRWKYYGIEEAHAEAAKYFIQLMDLHNSHNYDAVTLQNHGMVNRIIAGFGCELGFHIKRNKVGRNSLCPCGSGKKYKKCCLECT